MATLRSLGLHTPAALQYLIHEGVLDPDSSEHDYTWETYYDDSEGHTDDVVATEHHVVWSRGGLVRKSYNFEVEKERVVQALLTWFPTEETVTAESAEGKDCGESDLDKSFLTQGTQPATSPNGTSPPKPRTVEGRARALVVILRSQAHVFFISGALHIVHLPFEVERAFPAARGVVLQRKRPHIEPVPPSPHVPSAPPNSFVSNGRSFNSQGSFPQSLSQQSRRKASSLGPSRVSKLKQPSANALLLQELAKSCALPTTDNLPRHYSITDPLAELGLVVQIVAGSEPKHFMHSTGGPRRLEAIAKDEEILYVSPQNEILFDRTGNDKPLLIAVTANSDTNVITLWSAAYLEPKSMATSRKQHFQKNPAKSRRRSSYGPTAPGTGATTPALRGGVDRFRESFGGPATRQKTRQSSFNSVSQPKGRLSDQAVEDALESQLNPDYDATRHPRESRRVSSLLSRAELSTSFDQTAFQDLATSRTSLGGSFNASFGASQRSRHSLGFGRTSLGGFSQRNRASTPGSVVSRMSLGAASIDDTEFMEEDTLDTIDDYDELDDLFSPGTAFGQEAGEGLRKELVLSPMAEISAQRYLKPGLFSMKDCEPGEEASFKVFTLAAPFNSATLHERKMYVYIKHSALKHPLQCELTITRKRLSAAASTSRLSAAPMRYACVAKFVDIEEVQDAIDLAKLVDGQIERVLCLTSTKPKECLSLTAGWGMHLPMRLSLGHLRLFDPSAVIRNDQMRATAGLSRTVTAHQPLRSILSPGGEGSFDLLDGDYRRHRIRMQLAPTNPSVANLFEILSVILPNYAGQFLLEIWWNVRSYLSNMSQPKENLDWIAFVTTLFSLAMPFVDERTVKTSRPEGIPHSHKRTSARLSSHARPDEVVDSGASAWHTMCSRQDGRLQAKGWQATPWAWVLESQPSSSTSSPPTRRSSGLSSLPVARQIDGKTNLLIVCATQARMFLHSPMGKALNDMWRRHSATDKQDPRISVLSEIVVTLHLICEERKLNILSQDLSANEAGNLTPVLAQLGHWLRWESWTWKQGSFYDLDGALTEKWLFEDSHFKHSVKLHNQPWDTPPSILEWICTVLRLQAYVPYPTLAILIRKSKASPHSSVNIDEVIQSVTPRTVALHKFFQEINNLSHPRKAVELIERCGITTRMIATLPEAAKAPLMEVLTRCQANPPTTWSSSLLKLIGREDLDLNAKPTSEAALEIHQSHSNGVVSTHSSAATRDVHSVCQSIDRPDSVQSLAEVERHAITRMIFNEDKRFMEVFQLLEPLKQSVAFYPADSRQDEAAILEGQKAHMQWVMVRTFSLPIGSSMVKFNSKKPLLTEKYPLYGFSTSCLMKPMGNVVTVERNTFTEEKYFWAFFNAGVSAGLSIAKDAQGIDTSWIMYNKPTELTNKHAGLLLGLGLNGHLKNIAKWLSFKYLTPKHTMTSVGLLLGLSASYMGTMDTLVTRLLSVHVTRMLPAGAAELNLSPYTQTTGLMGIGLLYYNTQHRRMSEVMLSEIEHVDEIDPSEPPDTLRDEAYRLAAGFALGFINLAKGNDLRGLRDMRLVERLLKVAVAPKYVHTVHILDQATPGAVIAIGLIFMKTHDEAVARKIDVPDTLPQFDYVRPDIFLLRTLAKHIIMWDHISASDAWIKKNLPPPYRKFRHLESITHLRSDLMPFFNILAGLLWSISLKHAGTGDPAVKTFLLTYLDHFLRLAKLPASHYDAKLARNAVRACQDLLALAAATVMSGTGDLDVLRRLRGLHGRVGPEVPYGSHLAAHMALGALFVGGGTHAFGTSEKAVASLMCAFYPLWPGDVQDAKAHLQAFRHFWVLAAERRSVVVRDVDTGRVMSLPVVVTLKARAKAKATSPNDSESGENGKRGEKGDMKESKEMRTPCLLPELHTIASLRVQHPAYWPITLDFVNNANHLAAFRSSWTILVRRRPARLMYGSAFSATLVALNETQTQMQMHSLPGGGAKRGVPWDWIFSLPALRNFDRADLSLILASVAEATSHAAGVAGTAGTGGALSLGGLIDERETLVDTRLALGRAAESWEARELWGLRALFEWVDCVARMEMRGDVGDGDGDGDGEGEGEGRRVKWLGREVVEGLRARVLRRVLERGGG